MSRNDKQDIIPAGLEQLGSGPAYKAKICRMLEKTRLFGELSSSEIEILGQHMDAFRAPAGTTLFAEGMPAGFMSVIVEGHLEIYKDSGRGVSRKIADLASGSSVGEMGLIDGYPRSATAIAREPLLLLILRGEDLDRLIETRSQVAVAVMRQFAQVISHRLRKASGMLADYLE